MTPTAPVLRRRPATPAAGLWAALLTALLCFAIPAAFPRAARAEGTFIPASGRVDMVHDAARDTLYITAGRSVLRYRIGTGTFLSPYTLPAGVSSATPPPLAGIDLSPDGNQLAVADRALPNGQVCVWLIDLTTGLFRRVTFAPEFYEGGVHSVAYAADGSLLLSTNFQGSGWTPLRRYVPSTGQTVRLGSVSNSTMLSANASRDVIGFAEGNSSDGPWGRYRLSDNSFAQRSGYTDGTSWFNYEIGVSRDGGQFALPTYGGCHIYDGAFNKMTVIGSYAAGHPIGVAYDPTADRVYFAWATTREVRAYDTNTLTPVASFDFENVFDHPGNGAYVEGRLRISRDGRLLFATVADGVRLVRVRESLRAAPQVVNTPEDTPVAVTLSGFKNDGTPAAEFRVVGQPRNGTLSGTAPNLTYTPNPNYWNNGDIVDTFTFVAVDGTQESAPATVSLRVWAVNDPPTARDIAARTDEDTPVAVTLLGSDPENQRLFYSVTGRPAHGTLSGTAPNLTYTPAPDFHGTDTFTYIVFDSSQALSSTATVTITVAPVNDAPVAVDDAATTNEDAGVLVPVLSNDTDKDGNTLTLLTVGGAAHGTVTIENGAARYTPDPDYSGPDSFTYTIADGVNGIASATVRVDVRPVNDAPLAVDDAAVTRKGVAVSIPVTVNDSDKEGEALTVVSVGQASVGSVAITAAGTVRFTPTKQFVGTTSFTYTVRDASGATATATVRVTVNRK